MAYNVSILFHTVIIIDDSDVNWWKGSNHRGEGLFPANFVTKDLEVEPEQFKEEKQRRRSVQFNEEVEISEDKIDNVLRLLHEADPTSPETDPVELPVQEETVNGMGPLIDAELESVDRRHAQLTRLSTELVDALNLYHQLMHENMAMMPPQGPTAGYPSMPGPYMPLAQQQMYPGPSPATTGTFMSNGQQQHPHSMPSASYYAPPAPGVAPSGPPTIPPTSNGVPSSMQGYPTQLQQQQPPQGPGEHSNGQLPQQQMFAGSAPPPPTPPLSDQSQIPPQHFQGPQHPQSR